MINSSGFELVPDTAKRLNVSVRAVQKWASNGRIPGAVKMGRTWFIPKDAVALDASQYERGLHYVFSTSSFRKPLPLLNSSIELGKSKEYIETILDEDDRQIALGEYYYYSGQGEKAIATVKRYLNSDDPSLRYSSSIICLFANLSIGSAESAKHILSSIEAHMLMILHSEAPINIQAIAVFTATAVNVLMHLPILDIPPLEKYLRYLPGGMKLWGCYILAYKANLDRDYSRALAITDTAMALCPQNFPIAEMYVHLSAAISLIHLKRKEEARDHFDCAWNFAQRDNLIEPYAELHGLLHGLVEIYFKRELPKTFNDIISLTRVFGACWRKVHKDINDAMIADNLTTTEFAIAMLYSHGWSIKEVANHMDISNRTVSNYIATIYSKLGINSRRELTKHML